MRLLVVEDEAKLAAFIRQGLTEESFSVDVAARGEDALEMVDRTAYDLVILDIMLPGPDGFSAMALAVRSSPRAYARAGRDSARGRRGRREGDRPPLHAHATWPSSSARAP